MIERQNRLLPQHRGRTSDPRAACGSPYPWLSAVLGHLLHRDHQGHRQDLHAERGGCPSLSPPQSYPRAAGTRMLAEGCRQSTRQSTRNRLSGLSNPPALGFSEVRSKYRDKSYNFGSGTGKVRRFASPRTFENLGRLSAERMGCPDVSAPPWHQPDERRGDRASPWRQQSGGKCRSRPTCLFGADTTLARFSGRPSIPNFSSDRSVALFLPYGTDELG
jgi:hypothetical protein